MNIRYLTALLIPSILLIGCATNQERTVSESRSATAQREMMRDQFDRVQFDQMRREHLQMQRHYHELALMQERQQMQENIAGR